MKKSFASQAEKIEQLRAGYESAPKMTMAEWRKASKSAEKPSANEQERRKRAKKAKKRKMRGLDPGMRRTKSADAARTSFVNQVLKNVQSRQESGGAPAPATQTGPLGWRPSSRPSSTGQPVSSREPLGEAHEPQASSEAVRSVESRVPGPPEDRSSLGQTGEVQGETPA